MIRRSGYIFNSYNVKSRITNVVVDCIRNIILRRAYENARNENVIAVITGGIIHDWGPELINFSVTEPSVDDASIVGIHVNVFNASDNLTKW